MRTEIRNSSSDNDDSGSRNINTTTGNNNNEYIYKKRLKIDEQSRVYGFLSEVNTLQT